MRNVNAKSPGAEPPDRDDPHDLQRFVDAQSGVYREAITELRQGAKRSHWMWFVFPQVAGLGTSMMATTYAIRSRAEAEAYLSHPILGPRLEECAHALLAIEGKSAEQVMGRPDDVKLRSSMTLFAAVSRPGSPYHAVLNKYFGGISDEHTVRFLTSAP